jgi:hypothetical protein
MINFTVTAQGGTGPCTYAWYVDNQSTQTTTSPYYSINSLAIGSHHVYVIVTDANSSTATTLAVAFEVLPNPSSSPEPSPSVPEFPSVMIILPLIVITVLVAFIILGRKNAENSGRKIYNNI